tara:strand:- start:1082 stop:1303 length:222 start_codon:yes stop_codon:yes gene_type:complete
MTFQDPKYPVPKTVSSEAQVFLANTTDMSGIGGAKPQTEEEWQERVDSAIFKLLDSYSSQNVTRLDIKICCYF